MRFRGIRDTAWHRIPAQVQDGVGLGGGDERDAVALLADFDGFNPHQQRRWNEQTFRCDFGYHSGAVVVLARHYAAVAPGQQVLVQPARGVTRISRINTNSISENSWNSCLCPSVVSTRAVPSIPPFLCQPGRPRRKFFARFARSARLALTLLRASHYLRSNARHWVALPTGPESGSEF